MPDEKREEFGAVWERKTKAGGRMLSGTIGGVEVVAFPGNDKNPKGPAWRFFESIPREHGVQEQPPPDEDDLPF